MKIIFKLMIVLLVVTLLTGCSAKMNKIVSTSGHLATLQKIDRLDDDTVTRLNNFGLNLYHEIYQKDENIFISPASIYLALGMTYNGADKNTAKEMAKVLGVSDLSLDGFNQLCRDLQYLILGYEKSKFELANSIWLRNTFEEFINDDFIVNNKDYFGAMISSLDFDDPSTIDVINAWVNKNTKGRIKKAIEENKIDGLTVMYLINTIYFKSDWQTPFEEKNTTDQEFTTPTTKKIVKMMNKVDNLGYIENNELQGVLLPYNDNKTAMFLLLPKNEISNLDLSLANLNNLITSMKNHSASINLSMPKVKIEHAEELNDSLSKLGMDDAFSGRANFSKMATNAIEAGLHISNVTHKTFLAIDEKGTEAAAMTKVEIKNTVMSIAKYTMNINHPFIVGIIDKESGAILFIGAIADPSL